MSPRSSSDGSTIDAPVVELDTTVVLPGAPTEILIPSDTAAALSAYGDLLGFGCHEVVLASPADETRAFGVDNMRRIAVLAEVFVGGPRSDGRVPFAVGESHRVAIVSVEAAPRAYARVWSGHWARVVPATPTSAKSFGLQDRKALEAALAQWVLGPSCEQSPDEVSALLSTLVSESAPAWRTVYVAAALAVDDREARTAILEEDDLRVAAERVLDALRRENGASDAEAREQLAAFVEFAVVDGARRLREAIDAASVLMRAGAVVPTSGEASRALREARGAAARLVGELSDIADGLGEGR